MYNKFDKIKEGLQYFIYIYPQRGKNINTSNIENISIFGMSRGGTTWLANLLQTIPNSQLIWEPLFKFNTYRLNKFNPFAYPERTIEGFHWNQYIPQNERWNDAELFFDKLFNRKILNLKLLRFNKLKDFNIEKNPFIYKFCFGNLALPWLADRYNIKPIVLVRHPAAVVASSLSFGKHFDWHKENPYVSADTRQYYNEILINKYKTQAQNVKSPEALLAFQWCLQYKYLIEHEYNNNKWLTVSYESLFLNPSEELSRIFNYLGYEIPKDIMSKILKPSASSSKNHSKDTIANGTQLSSWRDKLSEVQIKNILNTLVDFEIDFYDYNVEPKYDLLYSQK